MKMLERRRTFFETIVGLTLVNIWPSIIIARLPTPLSRSITTATELHSNWYVIVFQSNVANLFLKIQCCSPKNRARKPMWSKNITAETGSLVLQILNAYTISVNNRFLATL